MKGLERVFCLLDKADKLEAIDQVITECSVFDDLPDRKRFMITVHNREKEASTGVGHGVAIAHGKVPGIEHTHVALGFSEEGIAYDSKYPEPVHLLFVIASPPLDQTDYIKAVAAILSWVHDPEVRSAMMKDRHCREAEEFLSMLISQRFEARNKE